MQNLLFTKNQLILIITLVLSISLSDCEKSSENGFSDVSLDSLNIGNYPKIDGSTSAHPLQVLIACEILGVEYSWISGWFDETSRIWPSFEKKPEIAQFIADSIVHNGTHSSYENLITGNADIILVAREASADELELADSLDVRLTSIPIALDAFVFIVNTNNPISGLTEKQIQDIYTGSITNWEEVGGSNSNISPYQRNPNSGSQELMLSLVMNDLTMMDFPEMIIYGMMGTINQISHDWWGLGYTVYFYEQFMAPNDDLKLLAVNGILPSTNSLREGDYLYTTKVYASIRENLEESSTARILYEWLKTSEGQAVIQKSGYIPYY